MAGWLSHKEEESGEWSRVVGVLTLDVGDWAEENFGSCDLKDARRTRRAVTVARQMAEYPDGSSPAQTERWSDLKALYRLFNVDEVTFSAVARPHWQRTRSLARGTVLLIGDTMWRPTSGYFVRWKVWGRRGRVWTRLLPAQFDDGGRRQR